MKVWVQIRSLQNLNPATLMAVLSKFARWRRGLRLNPPRLPENSGFKSVAAENLDPAFLISSLSKSAASGVPVFVSIRHGVSGLFVFFWF